ncbi:MAG: hypothetical protein JWN67_5040 [Actinomycetia bacterium]|nr:hypothetical protein [Actinomycetes bacterium]
MSAGIVYDANVKLLISTAALANNAAPTQAEVAASVNYSAYIPPDGITFGLGNSRVSGASIDSAFDSERMGRFQASLAIVFKRRLLNAAQLAWDAFKVRGVTGTVIIAPFGITTAAAEGYVFPDFQTGIPELNNPSANSEQVFTVQMALGTAPNMAAVFAA